MIYANFDDSGKLLGFYDDELHSAEQIPETAKEISFEVYQAFLENQGKLIINCETLQIEEIPPPNKQELEIIEQQKINAEALNFLNETAWKVERHRDQLDLKVQTSLTNEEFQELLQQRQQARTSIT